MPIKDFQSYKEKLLLRNCKNNRPAENFTLDRKAGSDFIPVEVKYTTFTSPKPGRSFVNFIKKYNPPRGLILTKGFREEIKIDNTEVLFAPVWFI